MIFQLNSDSKLKLSDKVLIRFCEYRQIENTTTEAGGVLLGRFIEESNDIIVDLISEPMSKDIRKRCFFKKNLVDHQAVVDDMWKKSDGTCNYLGEWHTHPEKNPSPSLHDRNEWKRVLKMTQCDSTFLLFLIVGTETIGAWVGNRENLYIKKIEECEC